MRHKTCPQCTQPTDIGSHWDCVFDMLAAWVAHRAAAEKKSDLETSLKKVEETNG